MKTEQELRDLAKRIASRIKKPHDTIPLKKVMFREINIEKKVDF